jgi:DNA-directed RNA polymerase specialized sigma54-like protein
MKINTMEIKNANRFMEDEQNLEGNIEIYFSNLDEETQDKIMKSIKDVVNAAEDDELSDIKIQEALSKKPIWIVRGEDLQKQMGIDI